MKIWKVLAGGWLAGGALIVLLSALTGAGVREPFTGAAVLAAESGIVVPVSAATAAAGRHGKVEGVDRPYPAGSITIPVSGIQAADLRDTFYDARSGGRVHRAIDILAPHGTPVLAAVKGPVRKIYNSRAGGLTIYQFDEKSERVYYYAHLDRYAEQVAEGVVLEQGAIIGYVGTTGNTAGTPHLHFSIEDLPPTKEWWKGSPVNPFPILRSASAGPA